MLSVAVAVVLRLASKFETSACINLNICNAFAAWVRPNQCQFIKRPATIPTLS